MSKNAFQFEIQKLTFRDMNSLSTAEKTRIKLTFKK